LLCVDRNTGDFVVIELKRGRADRNAFGQICSYVGWVQSILASGKPVVGLVLSNSYNEKFRYCLKLNLNIRHYELSELGLA
jgi:RecB family endonuclease NucS